jgi:hypothetical protein
MHLWSGGATRAVSSTLAPDGVSFATLATSVATSYGGFVRSLSPYSAAVGQAVTVSCWVKKGNHRYVAVIHDSIRTPGNIQPFFDLDTLTFNANGVGTFTHSIVSYPNGWYRLSISGTSISTTSFSVDVWMVDSNGNALNSLGSSQTVLWWGAQLEAGSFATSYIPTTTGTLARSADVCSITGGNFTSFYNTPEGTLFAGVTPQSVAQAAVVVGVNTATFLNSHFIYKSDSTANVAGLRWVGASQAAPAIPSTTDVATTFAKIAYAYKSGSFAMAYNNILAGTSSFTVISNPTAMRIGARDGGLAINGHISEVKYFKKRLPNAKLVQLTV